MPSPMNKLQKTWYPILFPYHKNKWLIAYKKVRTKISGYKTKYGIDTEELIRESYGTECIYCTTILKVRNMSLDHIIPQYRDGENSIENAQIICKKCNRRKSILTHLEYFDFLIYLRNKSPVVRDYFLRKLSTKDPWGNK